MAWRLTPHAVGERTTFLTMLKHLPTDAVLLLDRDYPSHDVLEAIIASGRDVVMRMVAMRDRRIAVHDPDLTPSAIRNLYKTPRDDSD